MKVKDIRGRNVNQPKLRGALKELRWSVSEVYQRQLTIRSEKGKGVFHSGSWERLHEDLFVLTWANSL